MLFYVDLGQYLILNRPDIIDPATSFQQKAGSEIPIEIQFVRDGVPVLNPDATELVWEIKPQGHYQESALVKATGFTAPADPTTGNYEAIALFNDLALLAQFLDTTSNIPGMLEIAWRPDAGRSYTRTSNTPDFLITNFVVDDTDAPTSQEIPSIVVWLSGITGLTGGANTDLDGLATANAVRPLGQVVAIIYQGVENHYQLTTGNPASNPPDVVIPVDHDAATNNVYWQRIPLGAVAGVQGPQGYSVLNGIGAPAAGTGNDGDFYLDPNAWIIYGPKAAGAWPAGHAITGPAGAASVILSGAGAPAAGTGNDDDCYVDTANLVFYGPKANGAWPAGVSLIGNTWLTGMGAPAAALGRNGDWYIASDLLQVFGPKTNGAWPLGRSIVGPQGAAGVNANRIIGVTAAPTGAVGNDGDFAVDTANLVFYGPRANGAWPTGVSMYGNTLLSGTGAPAANIGRIGDFYIDSTGQAIYGPKSQAGWGAATSLSPNKILSGSGAPLPTLGNVGDFYIDNVKLLFYGPKASVFNWPLPVSIVSPPQSIIVDGAPIANYREVGIALPFAWEPGQTSVIADAWANGSAIRALSLNQSGTFKCVFFDVWIHPTGADPTTGTRIASNVRMGAAATQSAQSVLDLAALPLDAKGAKFLPLPAGSSVSIASALPPAPPNFQTTVNDILPDNAQMFAVADGAGNFSVQFANKGAPLPAASLVTGGAFTAVTGMSWSYKYVPTTRSAAQINPPAGFTLYGAPAGIAIGQDGTISGNWPAAGTYSIAASFLINNSDGTVTYYYDTFKIFVADRQIDTLPAGVAFDAATATLSGTIASNGEWWFLFQSGNSFFWFGLFGNAPTTANVTVAASIGDYAAGGMSGLLTVFGLLKGDGQGNFSPAVAGTDYLTPHGIGTYLTGLLSTQLQDSTAAGRALLTAADVPTQLAFLGLTDAVSGVTLAQALLFLGLAGSYFGFAAASGQLYTLTPTADLEFDINAVTADLALGLPLRFPGPNGAWYSLSVLIENNVPQLQATEVQTTAGANASALKFTFGGKNYTIAVDNNGLAYWVPA